MQLFVALLLHFVGCEDGTDGSMGMGADFLSPGKKAVCIPAHILAMFMRHMLGYRAVLSFAPVKPGVGADAGSAEKYLNHISGQAHIHFVLDIFIRDAVLHLVHTDVVVGLDGGDPPTCQFIRLSRQLQKRRVFLFQKSAVPAPGFLLKRLAVQFSQFFLYHLIQLHEGEKLLTP